MYCARQDLCFMPSKGRYVAPYKNPYLGEQEGLGRDLEGRDEESTVGPSPPLVSQLPRSLRGYPQFFTKILRNVVLKISIILIVSIEVGQLIPLIDLNK